MATWTFCYWTFCKWTFGNWTFCGCTVFRAYGSGPAFLDPEPISVLKIPAKKLTAGVVDADDESFVGNVDTDKELCREGYFLLPFNE